MDGGGIDIGQPRYWCLAGNESTVDWNTNWAHGSRALAVLRWSWPQRCEGRGRNPGRRSKYHRSSQTAAEFLLQNPGLQQRFGEPSRKPPPLQDTRMVSESPAAISMGSPKVRWTRRPSRETFTGTGFVPSNTLAELAAPGAISRESVRNFSLPQRSLHFGLQAAALLLLRKGPPAFGGGEGGVEVLRRQPRREAEDAASGRGTRSRRRPGRRRSWPWCGRSGRRTRPRSTDCAARRGSGRGRRA